MDFICFCRSADIAETFLGGHVLLLFRQQIDGFQIIDLTFKTQLGIFVYIKFKLAFFRDFDWKFYRNFITVFFNERYGF